MAKSAVFLTPDNDADGNIWYWWDVPAMLAFGHIDPDSRVAPFILQALPGSDRTLPRPAAPRVCATIICNMPSPGFPSPSFLAIVGLLSSANSGRQRCLKRRCLAASLPRPFGRILRALCFYPRRGARSSALRMCCSPALPVMAASMCPSHGRRFSADEFAALRGKLLCRTSPIAVMSHFIGSAIPDADLKRMIAEAYAQLSTIPRSRRSSRSMPIIGCSNFSTGRRSPSRMWRCSSWPA